MAQLNLSAPWILFYREVEAMFERDREVKVVFIDSEDEPKSLNVYVESSEKASAIRQLLVSSEEFGSVHLNISVIPANGNASKRNIIDVIELFETAFENNPAYRYIEKVDGIFSNPIYYVVFDKKVVQYFTDDIGDAHGVCSTLYQEIAKDIFSPLDEVHYCTDTFDYARF